MRAVVDSVLEVAGAVAVMVGVYLLAGLGWTLIVAGLATVYYAQGYSS